MRGRTIAGEIGLALAVGNNTQVRFRSCLHHTRVRYVKVWMMKVKATPINSRDCEESLGMPNRVLSLLSAP